MANGTELKTYRQKILTLLLNDKEICELILNRTISDIDDADVQNELTENNIYKYRFVPNTPDEQKTYVAFELSARANGDDYVYKKMKLMFYIFTHHDIISHSTGYLRTDLLDERIQDIFNENKDFGLGKMKCVGDDPLNVNASYYGRQLEFIVKERNGSRCN